MYPDVGLNCILLLTVFLCFNSSLLSFAMQGACAIEDGSSLCVEDNACGRSTVVLCLYTFS